MHYRYKDQLSIALHNSVSSLPDLCSTRERAHTGIQAKKGTENDYSLVTAMSMLAFSLVLRAILAYQPRVAGSGRENDRAWRTGDSTVQKAFETQGASLRQG